MMTECTVYLCDADAGFIVAGPVPMELAMKIIEKNEFWYRQENLDTIYVAPTKEAHIDKKYGCIDVDALEEIPGVVYG